MFKNFQQQSSVNHSVCLFHTFIISAECKEHIEEDEKIKLLPEQLCASERFLGSAESSGPFYLFKDDALPIDCPFG
jgi:hypothetical protein